MPLCLNTRNFCLIISLLFVTFVPCWCFIYLPEQDCRFQRLLPLPGEDTKAEQPVVNRRSFENMMGLVLHGSCSRMCILFMHIFTLVILTGRERLANTICRSEVSLLVVLVMVSLLRCMKQGLSLPGDPVWKATGFIKLWKAIHFLLY